MPSPGNQFFSEEFGDIEDYFISDYAIIDRYIGDQLWTWGNNISGTLGDNTTIARVTPVTTFAGGTNWKQVSVRSFAIKTDGTLWVWGNNIFGQLGNNATTNRSTPVTTFAGGTNWKQVSTINVHCAAIKTDGTLWTWGAGDNGRLGNNATTNRSTPVTTFAGGTNWKQVSSANGHTAAIKTDGTLWTWGVGSDGALGTNDSTTRSTPVTTFAGGNNWKQVSGGISNTAAIKTDGTLWIWGRNATGQLGTNNVISRSTPVTTFAGGTNWKQVSCGGDTIGGHTAAIKTNGTLWTWGYNYTGQLGDNTATQRLTPVTTFAGGINWKQVDCGSTHTAAIKTDGTLWTWGQNNADNKGSVEVIGILGINDSTTSINRLTPVTTFAGGTNWKQVDCGQQFTAAIKSGLTVDF